MHVQLGRIVRNTGFLYLRHFVLCVGDLYATRLVLGALGTDGFGLVAAVGAVTAMLAFLRGVLGSTAQRFLSAEIGKGDGGDLSAAFASVCGIALLLGAAILLAPGGKRNDTRTRLPCWALGSTGLTTGSSLSYTSTMLESRTVGHVFKRSQKLHMYNVLILILATNFFSQRGWGTVGMKSPQQCA